MYHTVVITCGTSFNASSNIYSLSNMQKIKETPLDLYETNLSETTEDYILQWIEACKNIHSKGVNRPAQISAEYSTLYALKQLNQLHKQPTVILIVTNSVGGRMADRLLKYLFERDFAATVKVVYVTLDVSSQNKLNQQIGMYMSELTNALSQGEPNSTCFVPLGGYKFMTSYGYIVGSMLKYPTVYVNEHTQQLIQIPWVPINVDQTFIEKNTPLLRKCLNDYIRIEDLHYEEQELVFSHPYVFEVEDGLVCLTPFGQFLLQQFERHYIFGTQYFLSKQVRNLIKDQQDQSIFVAQQMQELVKKIKLLEKSDLQLMHEKDFKDLDRSKIINQLYKGASNGRHVFRLAYYYEKSEDRLYANYLWLDHKLYEREVANGKGLYSRESTFRDATDEIARK